MKICGIIAEFNPFHEGHAYLLREARRVTGADRVLVIMSPDFVQRGGPAVLRKHDRVRAALEAGCDCVAELPVQFACGSARTFARAGVTLLAKAGADCICFGSGSGDLTALKALADVLTHETDEFRAALRQASKNGYSYPSAVDRALCETVPGSEALAAACASPNDRLAVEYLMALNDHPGIEAFAVRRIPGVSASDLRDQMFRQGARGLRGNDFSAVLSEKLLSADDLTVFEDVDDAISARIRKFSQEYPNFEDLAAAVKTKAYTRTRIDRALTHILLGITSDQIRSAETAGYASHLRILGYRRESRDLISRIASVFPGPVLLKLTGASEELSGADKALFESGLYASGLWRAMHLLKYPDQELPDEYSAGVTVIPGR